MKSYEKIRQLREAKQWSQEQLANKLGLSPNGYAKIERGETRLTLSRLMELAEIFEMDILELIQGEIQSIDLRMGSHVNNGRDFTIYGSVEYKDLVQEIEKLKLIIKHQETLLEQQTRELALTQKMLAMYEQQS